MAPVGRQGSSEHTAGPQSAGPGSRAYSREQSSKLPAVNLPRQPSHGPRAERPAASGTAGPTPRQSSRSAREPGKQSVKEPGPARTPRERSQQAAEPGAQPPPAPKPRRAAAAPPKPQPHPGFSVAFADDATALMASSQAPQAAETGAVDTAAQGPATGAAGVAQPVLLLQLEGMTPQEATAHYALQWTRSATTAGTPHVVGPKRSELAFASRSSLARGSIKPIPKAPAKGAPAAVAAPDAEDSWQTMDTWVVQSDEGPALLAAKLPQDGSAAVTCRLSQRNVPDWIKWCQSVRQDPGSWLGQPMTPVVLGLARPYDVHCQVEGLVAEGPMRLLRLHWAVGKASNDCLTGPTHNWQYRWRLSASGASYQEDEWYLGPVLESRVEPSGVYCSPPLRGNWTVCDDGVLSCCVRYVDDHSAEWSPWSLPSEPVALGSGPPSLPTGPLQVEHVQGDPTCVVLTWEPFVVTTNITSPLEYRVLLHEGEAQLANHTLKEWTQVGWLEADPSQKQVTASRVASLPLDSIQTVCVQARYCGGGHAWSQALELTFRTPSTCVDSTSVPPPVILGTVESTCAPSGRGKAESTSCQTWNVRLPARFQELPATGLFIEWLPAGPRGDGAAWQPCAWQLEAAATELGHVNVTVELPGSHEQVLFRCRHVAGACSSMALLAPVLVPPAPPRAVLEAQDRKILFDVSLLARGKGHRLTSRYQVLCEDADTGQQILAPIGVFDPPKDRVALCIGRGDLIPGKPYCFRARLGYAAGWSPWSAPSVSAAFAISPPKPRSYGELGARVLVGNHASGVELRWDAFVVHSGLHLADYFVSVAPAERPEEADEVFIPGTNAFADGRCSATIPRLVPDTEYIAVVRASYPFLSHVCNKDDSDPFTARFRTLPVDKGALLPPAPPALLLHSVEPRPLQSSLPSENTRPLQSSLPSENTRPSQSSLPSENTRSLHHDEGQVIPLLLDSCVLGADPLVPHKYSLQWREVESARGTVSAWQPAAFQIHAKRDDSRVVAHCDLAGQLTQTSTSTARLPPRVQLRLCLEGGAARVASPQQLWYSDPSEVITTALGSTPAPVVALAWDAGHLQVSVSISLGTGEGHGSTTAPRSCVPLGFAHEHASRVAVRFRQTVQGGAAVEKGWHVEEEELSKLQNKAQAAPTGGTKRTVCMLLAVGRLPLEVGQAYEFSVRVGDTHSWSSWSAPSPATTVAMPPLVCPGGVLFASTPVNRKVVIEWEPLECDFGRVPVECFISMIRLHCDQEHTQQVIASHRDSAHPTQLGRPELSRPQVEVALQGFEPGQSYQFALWARHDALGAAQFDFAEVARSPPFTWEQRASEEWSVAVDWGLPVPCQRSVTEDLEEGSIRWQGQAVLLSWPPELVSKEAFPWLLQAREEQEDHAVLGWKTVENWVRVRLEGIDYVAATELPFLTGRFRWFDPSRKIPGPASEVCLTHLEATAPPTVTVFFTRSAIRIRVQTTFSKQQSLLSSSFRVRYRTPGTLVEAPSPWVVLNSRILSRSGAPALAGSSKPDLTLGEEDGLELGATYVFSLQLASDSGRRSQWSEESSAVKFDVPLTFGEPSAGAHLAVQAFALTSVSFSWPALVSPAASRIPGSQDNRPPAIECRLDIHHKLHDGGSDHHTSLLLEETEDGVPTEASVFNLLPATEYHAELSVRLARIGTRRWQPTGLSASFVTPIDDGQLKPTRGS